MPPIVPSARTAAVGSAVVLVAAGVAARALLQPLAIGRLPV